MTNWFAYGKRPESESLEDFKAVVLAGANSLENNIERRAIERVLRHIGGTTERDKKELLRAAIGLWAIGKQVQQAETKAALIKKYKIKEKYGDLFAVADFIYKRDTDTERRFNEKISREKNPAERKRLERNKADWAMTAGLTLTKALREANKHCRMFVEGTAEELKIEDAYNKHVGRERKRNRRAVREK